MFTIEFHNIFIFGLAMGFSEYEYLDKNYNNIVKFLSFKKTFVDCKQDKSEFIFGFY